MRLNIRWDDKPKDGSYAQDHLCNLDVYVNTRDDLVKAQAVINGLLSILPAPNDPTSSTDGANR